MNKRYEEGHKPLFSAPGENERKQYVWAKNEKGEKYLQETESIDVQAEIESYADECDIKNIVRKASFDPQFLQSLQQGAFDGQEIDITSWPQSIHEYHQMLATAQANAIQLQQMQEAAKQEAPKEEVKSNEQK